MGGNRVSQKILRRSHLVRNGNNGAKSPLILYGNGNGKTSHPFNPYTDEPSMRNLIDRHKELNPGKDITPIIKAYRFVRHYANGSLRKDGKTPALKHSVAVAQQAVDSKLGISAIIGGLNHDNVEDFGVFLFEIRKEFGYDAAEIINLLTKPRLVNREWVWADQKEFYKGKDEYTNKMYHERSLVYYRRLLNSGNLNAVLLKIFDNTHNLVEIMNLPEWKADRNIDTMVNHILWVAPRVLKPEALSRLVDELSLWGFEIPQRLMPIEPEKNVIVLPPRSKLGFDMIRSLPPSDSNKHASVYWCPKERTSFELGIDAELFIPLRDMRMIFSGSSVKHAKSLVGPEIGAHETIFRISNGKKYDLDVIARQAKTVYNDSMGRIA